MKKTLKQIKVKTIKTKTNIKAGASMSKSGFAIGGFSSS